MRAVLPAWVGMGVRVIRDEYDREDRSINSDVSMIMCIGGEGINLRGWAMSFGIVVKIGRCSLPDTFLPYAGK
jgi:hypothetical protein